MGGNQSKASSKVTNDFLTQITSSFMSSLNQSVSATGGTRQTVNLSGASFNGCRVKISQGASVTASASGTLTVQNQQALTAELQNKMAQKLQQSAEQKNGFLSPAFANKAETVSDVANRSNTIISTTMSSSTVQDIFAKALSNQDVNAGNLWMQCDPKYRNPGEYDFELDQNILQSITAKGVADAVTNSMQNDTLLNSAITDLSQHASQTNAGLDDLVKAIFAGLTGIWGIIGVILCVVCCAVLIFALSPAGQKATITATNAGANIARARYGGGAGL
jgi:hypothetical protein